MWTVAAAALLGVELVLASPKVITNGQISVGVDSDYGGAITWVADPSNNVNFVNLNDHGREIQQSYYSGPKPYGGGQWGGGPWPWNPITSGDVAGNTSPNQIQTVNDNELYVLTHPLQWALHNVSCECQFEKWITLDGKGFYVHNKLTTWRADRTDYGAYPQEVPAVYVNGPFYKLYSYTGSKPWQNDALTQVDYPVPGPPWASFTATEHWAAMVNSDGVGLGVMNTDSTHFLGGFAGTQGQGGPTAYNTGYIAPTISKDIPAQGSYEWGYHITIGNLQMIRSYFQAKQSAII
jgi:hypothetical protein